MSGSPSLKVFNSQGEYIGCLKHYEDAACIVASYGTGASVRFGHNKRNTLWKEGSEEFSAGDSYDRAGNVMREREAAMWAAGCASQVSSTDKQSRSIDDVPSCGQENDYRRATTNRGSGE